MQKNKFVVAVNGPDNEANVAVVIANSVKYPVHRMADWSVLVGVDQGFHHETYIDGRWPWTLAKFNMPDDCFKFPLDATIMSKVDVAIVRGLKLIPIRRPPSALKTG